MNLLAKELLRVAVFAVIVLVPVWLVGQINGINAGLRLLTLFASVLVASIVDNRLK